MVNSSFLEKFQIIIIRLVLAEVSNFTTLQVKSSFYRPVWSHHNDVTKLGDKRSSIATIKNCQIGIATWITDSLASCSLNK